MRQLSNLVWVVNCSRNYQPSFPDIGTGTQTTCQSVSTLSRNQHRHHPQSPRLQFSTSCKLVCGFPRWTAPETRA